MKQYLLIGSVMVVVGSVSWVLEEVKAGRYWSFLLGITTEMALTYITLGKEKP